MVRIMWYVVISIIIIPTVVSVNGFMLSNNVLLGIIPGLMLQANFAFLWFMVFRTNKDVKWQW